MTVRDDALRFDVEGAGSQATDGQRLRVWVCAFGAFYAVWAWLVIGHGRLAEVAAQWPISLTMLFGSYVAGSTPMGGGTVAFPILVLLFDQPASLGRDFSFAVQSVGMTSASLFIWARRQALATSLLRGSLLGSLVGTPIGVLWVAPHLSELGIKLVFALLWASFGVFHVRRLGELSAQTEAPTGRDRVAFQRGVVLGLVAGATVAASTGVGIDMVIYTALILVYRVDLKVAIPTSVVLMAFTSLVGVAVKSMSTGLVDGVEVRWLAAAPVVCLGAPLGAFVVDVIGRRPTLLLVAALCIGQFVWVCHEERDVLGPVGVLLAICGVAVAVGCFEALRSLGRPSAP